jgi:hypothetical protein
MLLAAIAATKMKGGKRFESLPPGRLQLSERHSWCLDLEDA